MSDTIEKIRKAEHRADCLRHAAECRFNGTLAIGTADHIQSFELSAKSLELEAETGVVHCVCHLIPMEECRKRAGTRRDLQKRRGR